MANHVDADPSSDFELKHRIVGAVILVIVAVVVLPAILKGSDPRRETPSSPLTTSDPMASRNNDFVSRITPIGPTTVTGVDPATFGADPEPVPLPEPSQESDPPASRTPTQPVTDKGAASPPTAVANPAPVVNVSGAETASAPSKPAPPEPAAEPTREPTTPSVERGWVVRVGTFSKPENAARLTDALIKQGFSAASSKFKTKSGSATRVWVGPFSERVQAARARTDIEKATGEKGLITAYP